VQKLRFESSWDKTLSAKDRERIKQVFLETSTTNKSSHSLAPLWQAINHKGDLLMTVLVHNFDNQALSFHNKKLRYVENNKVMAEHIFTLPSLTIEYETSMPWTFIFPAEKWNSRAALENGHLEVVN
jgi:SLAP domain-containing protein